MLFTFSEPSSPSEWLIEGFLPPQDIVMLHGQSGVGKSLFAMALCAALSGGSPFMGKRPQRPVSVLYFDADNPTDIIKRRYHLLFAPPKADLTNPEVAETIRLRKQNFKLISRRQQWLSLCIDNDKGDKLMRTEIAEQIALSPPECPLRLVVFDPLAAFHGANENDNVAMRHVMGWFKQLALEYNITILLTHSEEDAPPKGVLLPEDAPRGASSIRDCTNICYRLTHVLGTEQRQFTTTKWHDAPPLPPNQDVEFFLSSNGELRVLGT